MAEAVVSFERNVAAPREVVFEVLTDHRGYAAITPLRSVELEREGEPAPNGVGAIRVLRVLGPPLREEVLAYEPPERFAYKIISGAPVRDHLGTVTLTEAPAGTRLDYRLQVTPSIPAPAFVTRALMRLTVGSLVRGIVREAERRAAGATPT